MVDYDPASGCFYAPVDLNDPHLLAQDGLAPSGGEPAVPPADGLRRGDDHDPQLRAAPGPARPSGRPHRARRADGTSRPRAAADVDRPAAADLPARPARGERLLQPGEEGAALRLLPRRRWPIRATNLPGGTGLHLPVARHHRPRDDARAARRPAPLLHRAEQPRRPGLPRGVRRHRRPVPALLPPRGAARTRSPRRGATWRARTCSGELAQQFGQAIGSHGALRDALGKPRPDDGQVESAGARPRGPTRRRPSRTTAARSWWRRSSTPSCRSTSRGSPTCCGSPPAARACCPRGDLHPDLVNRLAREAAKAAGHVLRMASGPSTTARRWTSPSASIFAP